jgi:hypothetical protein
MAYAALNDRMTMNEMTKNMEGSGDGLFQKFLEGTEEKHEKISLMVAEHQPRCKGIS